MPESTQEWFDRVSAAVARDGYRPWEAGGWTSWPFAGDLTVRELEPPAAQEPPRGGIDGVDCALCEESRRDDPRDYVFWRDDLMMLGVPFGSTSLPFMAFLMPRRHADLADLTSEEAARSGQVQSALERAVVDVLDVPRVQLARWGDGTEHLHWWVFGRPTAALQLRGTFLPIWDDVLPAREESDLRADLDLVAARLVELVGGQALPAHG